MHHTGISRFTAVVPRRLLIFALSFLASISACSASRPIGPVQDEFPTFQPSPGLPILSVSYASYADSTWVLSTLLRRGFMFRLPRELLLGGWEDQSIDFLGRFSDMSPAVLAVTNSTGDSTFVEWTADIFSGLGEYFPGYCELGESVDPGSLVHEGEVRGYVDRVDWNSLRLRIVTPNPNYTWHRIEANLLFQTEFVLTEQGVRVICRTWSDRVVLYTTDGQMVSEWVGEAAGWWADVAWTGAGLLILRQSGEASVLSHLTSDASGEQVVSQTDSTRILGIESYGNTLFALIQDPGHSTLRLATIDLIVLLNQGVLGTSIRDSTPVDFDAVGPLYPATGGRLLSLRPTIERDSRIALMDTLGHGIGQWVLPYDANWITGVLHDGSHLFIAAHGVQPGAIAADSDDEFRLASIIISFPGFMEILVSNILP